MEEIKGSRQSKIIAAGLLFIIFFASAGLVFWRLIKDNDDLARVIFVQVIALILFMVWVTKEGGIKFRKNPLNLPVLLYAGANAVALFATSNIYESLTAMLKIVIYCLIFFLAANNLKTKDAERSSVTVVIMGFVIAVIGLLQYFGLDWFRFLYSAAPTNRVFSILGNPDFLGGFLALVLPLSLVLVLNFGFKGREGIFGSISFAVILLCLLLTATRSALIAFIGSLIFLSIIVLLQKGMKNLKKRWIFMLVFSVVIVLILGFSGRGRVKSFLFRFASVLSPQTLKTDGAVQYRLAIWKTSLLMFKEHPVAGVGTGVFKLHYPFYQAKLRQADPLIPFSSSQESRVHNEYLQALAETGVIGIAGFFWLAVCAIFYGVKYIAGAKEPRQRIFLIGLVSGASVVLLDSVFAFPFHLTSHATLFWLFLGLIVVIGESAGTQISAKDAGKPAGQEPVKQRSKIKKKMIVSRRSWELISVAWVASAVLIILILRSFFGAFYYKQGIVYGNNQMDQQSIESYKRAIKLSPYDPEIHFTWGYICLNSGMIDDGLAEFKLVEKLYPWNEDNLLNLGVVYNNKREPGKALDYFRKAIMLNPGIGAAYFNVAGIYLNYYSNSPWAKEEAVNYCRKAVEIEPSNSYYREVLEKLIKE
ncbi:hypothetical protein COY52_00260 [Candidatus Desantisbacteria bacterium CG_4_10_14_0_8_um_filter_48_22]|uniref:O-antigen ligase-related domain-containing protein n=1 Tax=Candidatus Desantisbacteria bacterium CG_4_10_14_0_8_um_filter_48_22 TaxID=1974543 RepID=A0A2M7SFH2_9BACT|nr:MAG: hypothetical protein AUJ67_08565 [Candidatus Desantisbacteria bacterium CG1_02_49_89]PIV56188.1 MAG: hypothetical protein COS16_04770 [Candidatus Desantisbacteria bacterium CG02_land_8_20_14_3_00_49_13]PIZ18287.1 MAG: hypothetical protein COY52_00260 [Candidatus Desantisbacteria bacterium CG_4_10_14_0_8_um_filter_48_22]